MARCGDLPSQLLPEKKNVSAISHSTLKVRWLAALIKKLSALTMRDYFINLAVLACIIVTFALAYKICSKTMRCQRCRVDRAAQREERQARRAYKAAARRHKWRQWWEGKICHKSETMPMTPLAYDLPDRDLEQGLQSDAESYVIEPVNLQTEIQDFRQALEYVGDLFRESVTHPYENKVGEKTRLYKMESAGSDTAASSTVGLATIMSTGSSSLKSLDCKSSVTLDTLDSMESPPPSYHS
ncbi:hypothetical protein BO94DRAFT_534131 [Aspergillus sclerotioniger CBS 115572]|uniref:Uncharacterized protein n=1 Tax=Aspergillus sclerotioniger CBS 115572 TaxID=1450535 RepID=A0A317WU67_9EURO|nr:hypothetical protein BO94DRAFT_534131 [Aspergillus sclerotioniger CBS 115572]PWY89371.1 hypothetical protein BO94DRAFT_534131 [Aspergillus sclerotioniger CBS 115572]